MRIIDFADGFTSNVDPTVVTFDASAVSITPSGDISSTDVQSAIEELDSEKVPKVTSTDNAVTRFDGITGLVQNSGVTIDDSNNISGIGNVSAPGTSHDIGTSNSDSTINIGTGTGNNTINIGGANTQVNITGIVENQDVTNVNVTDKLVTINKGGSSGSGAVAGMEVEEGGSATGRVVTSSDRNSWEFKAPNTSGVAKVTPGSSNDEIALLAKTQTLSGKTLSDELRMTQISTPSTPSAGFNKLYPKSDGKFYTLDPSGIEKPVGSGSGSGSKNYLSSIVTSQSATPNTGNGDFELGTTTGWSLFSTTITNLIPTGSISAGDSTLSLSILDQSSSPASIGGKYSLNVFSSGTHGLTSAGQGFISDAFYIDAEDQSKVLTIKFYYNCTTNGNLDFSGTSSNSFHVYIYDVTNSAWIQPAGVYGMTQGSGVGLCTATFQTTSNSTQYRLAVLTPAGFTGGIIQANAITFDDFSVGPQTAPIGPVVTDWTAYTPMGAWNTNVTYYGKWRRVGSEMEVRTRINISGTPNSTNPTISIPSGYSIDSSRLPNGSAFQFATSLGSWGSSNGTNVANGSIVYNASTTNVWLLYQNTTSGLALDTSVTQAAPGAWANGYAIDAQFKVPIVGWSSNVQMSSDTDTRVISWNGSQSSQSVTAGTTDIAFTTINDRTGSWNGTQFVVPAAGDYVVSGSGIGSGSGTLQVYKNGSAYNHGFFSSATAGLASAGSILVTGCVPGDLLSLRNNSTVTETSGNLGIFRLSGPSVIAATESVNARYSAGTTQSISNSSTTALTLLTTKSYDSHNAFNTSTGVYTVPVPGKYRATLTLGTNAGAAASSVNNAINVIITQAGSASQSANTRVTAMTTTSAIYQGTATDTFNCLAGDTLTFNGFTNLTGSAVTFGAALVPVYMTVERVGN